MDPRNWPRALGIALFCLNALALVGLVLMITFYEPRPLWLLLILATSIFSTWYWWRDSWREWFHHTK